MADSLKEESKEFMFGGWKKVYTHASDTVKCTMKFGIYLPPQAEKEKVPVVYWLSGLTCTEQNFMDKAGAQRYASELGLCLVVPDTSPRNCGIDGETDNWDFGVGAGFYVDATEEKWKTNYNMYSYITKELPEVINSNFNVDPAKKSITGHSMGGHGALICSLKNPGMYLSVSAFAPICNPIACPWGNKAFSGYLGSDKESWKAYDACELVKKYSGEIPKILIDQGDADTFLTAGQLLPDNFVAACASSGVTVDLRMQKNYNHGYSFIASFIEEHLKYHSDCINKTK